MNHRRPSPTSTGSTGNRCAEAQPPSEHSAGQVRRVPCVEHSPLGLDTGLMPCPASQSLGLASSEGLPCPWTHSAHDTRKRPCRPQPKWPRVWVV